MQSSNYAAEFGAVGGAVFNTTMKSGTNGFHGSAYDYAANEILNAHQPYTGLRNLTKRHSYGFTIGGPGVDSETSTTARTRRSSSAHSKSSTKTSKFRTPTRPFLPPPIVLVTFGTSSAATARNGGPR